MKFGFDILVDFVVVMVVEIKVGERVVIVVMWDVGIDLKVVWCGQIV